MSIGKLIAVIFGIFFLLLGLVFSVSGIAIFAVSNIYTDSDGYFNTPQFQLEQNSSVAVTLSDININIKDATPQIIQNDLGSIVTIRIALSSPNSYFIGVGQTSDVNQYLSNVSYSQINNVTWANGVEVTTSPINPSSTADLSNNTPTNQSFWDTYTTGNKVFQWAPKAGAWTIVIMKTDGSTGINVGVQAGAKVPVLTPIATFLVVIGIMFVILALVLFIVAATVNKKKIVTVQQYIPHSTAQVTEIPKQTYRSDQVYGTPSPKVQPTTDQTQQTAPAQANEEVYVVAEWGQRILAYIIDIIIVSIFVEMIRLPVILQDPTNGILLYPTGLSVNGVVLFLYFVLLESNYGTTIGKQALKLAVITEDGRKPEPREIALSALGKAFFLPVDLLVGLLVKDETHPISLNQRLMQKVSKTLVIVKPEKKSN